MPICVVAEIQLPLIEIVLRQFQNVSWQKLFASHRIYSKTFPNRVLAEFQLHLIDIFLRHFQIVSSQKLNSTSSKLFYDNSNFCRR